MDKFEYKNVQTIDGRPAVETVHAYTPLSDLKIGTVVQYSGKLTHLQGRLGHIVGFGCNPFSELLIEINFEGIKDRVPLHPTLVYVFC